MMKNIGKYILTGLVTMLPVILTLYLLYWLAVSAETLLGELIPQEIYFPGMGVAVALLAMFIPQNRVWTKCLSLCLMLLRRMPARLVTRLMPHLASKGPLALCIKHLPEISTRHGLPPDQRTQSVALHSRPQSGDWQLHRLASACSRREPGP